MALEHRHILKGKTRQIVLSFIAALLCAMTFGLPANTQNRTTQEEQKAEKTFAEVLAKAEQNDARSQAFVAEAYFTGLRVTRNHDLARNWWEKAGKLGHVEALANLGYTYKKGIGVKADPQKAEEYYRRAKEEAARE